MNKLRTLSLALISFFLLTSVVYADLINPEYMTKKCGAGEQEVECEYKSDAPFGPATFDGCAIYENNQDYYLLISEGHSFGGREKYCLLAGRQAVTNTGLLHLIQEYPTYFYTGIGVLAVVIISGTGLILIKKKNAHK